MKARPASAQMAATGPRSGTLLPLMLALAVIVSALIVVQVKHRNRSLTTRMEAARQERARLDLEWSQLQLEEATLAQHSRIDAIARGQFNMVDPMDYRILAETPSPVTSTERAP